MKSASLSISESQQPKIFKSIRKKLVFKVDYKSTFKKIGISLISILIFLAVWHIGASYLFNIEADSKIAKALADQGPAEAQ